jgi:FkbM family methyltransferase
MSIERIKEAASRRFKKAWEPVVHGLRTMGATDGYVRREVLGSQMYLDVKDPGICRDLILYGIREQWAIGVMKELLRPGQTVVDVGANIGFYVLLESLKVGPSGKVYAIEPVPDNYELLRRNVDLNRRGNIEMHRCAVGDKPGRAQMHLSHLRNWHAMTAVHATGRVIDVDVVTLDSFLDGKPAPSLVRMDVEGYEHEILRGMEQTLDRSNDLTLFIEIHPHIIGAEKMRSMLLLLERHGYQIARIASRRGEDTYTIGTYLADDAAMSGSRGGSLVFFSRPRQ